MPKYTADIAIYLEAEVDAPTKSEARLKVQSELLPILAGGGGTIDVTIEEKLEE